MARHEPNQGARRVSMSTIVFSVRCLIAALLLSSVVLAAEAKPLQPYKDALFGYPGILREEDGGDFRVIDYQEIRDINGRDQIPERRVKRAYLSLGVKSSQANETLDLDSRSLDVTRVGGNRGAAFTVIFIHGRGGDRRLGANDFSFGGNFNRLKNLAVNNGGTYYAPSVRSFDAAGVADIAALIHFAAERSGNRPVVLACASMGSFICWGISRDQQATAVLSGMMVMGGVADPAFQESAAYKARLPMFFSHGSNDSVYAAEAQVALYRSLKSKDYPARFVLFETGSHGTPVRMTDWRDALNWILER
ncbi:MULTISPECIES: alpha/beta hydrolase [Sinorhizobium]|uniref:Phospholipase n=2 Tax=Sinorhizobium TaxID=28105 RepID=A0A2S3YW24_9HYPH|nr:MULTISPECIES: alpha/beta fold hydrolase [Sinorhizobium]AUX76082.1 alpha/beta hydrolase family protein [Sinorhizobium fredii]PDT39931.1 phospholipase [Sinorhizobium sp. FG01]PDT55278.1 phospholipase [Sinorhizobium sp. NG07B]POH32315.1 phospholipase [Sinorhizobium americanum]POH35852.1 phospholipase [Sinorhizobium americanum]